MTHMPKNIEPLKNAKTAADREPLTEPYIGLLLGGMGMFPTLACWALNCPILAGFFAGSSALSFLGFAVVLPVVDGALALLRTKMISNGDAIVQADTAQTASAVHNNNFQPSSQKVTQNTILEYVL
jgi:hypothetical protein